MRAALTTLRARPQLTVAALVGIAAGLASPPALRGVTRAMIGWNVGVWLYLAMAWWLMARADHARMRRIAIAHAEGAAAVLATVTAAAAASLLAIGVELASAKTLGARYALPHVLFAIVTVVASWSLLPTLFALSYASLYYRLPAGPGGGLEFPGKDSKTLPDYWDFMYFSVTIAVASQTADVQITSQGMRRLVLLQSLVSFAFNTTILALTINIAAGLL